MTKQYEVNVITTRKVIVEADSEQQARITARNDFLTMTGFPREAIKELRVMEIAQPTAIFGSRGRGVIQ